MRSYVPGDLFSDGGPEHGDPPEPVSRGNDVHATRKVFLKRVFCQNSRFNQKSDLHNSGLLLAGFLGVSGWSAEREICHPEAIVGCFPDLRRRNGFGTEGIDGDPFLKERSRGTAALCQRGRRPVGDDTELPVQEIAFKGEFGIAGNTGGIAYAPAPFGGRDGARGGCRIGKSCTCADFPALHLPGIRLFQKFSGISNFLPEKSGRTNVRPELFWIF